MLLIKAECVQLRMFKAHEQAALEIFEYVECFYNKVRIHSALDNLGLKGVRCRTYGERYPEGSIEA
ncbi:IS3 family transposase [[Collinsella] massiliensis]|nr:IS3 family transposase [[Collinsella] massiliensis]